MPLLHNSLPTASAKADLPYTEENDFRFLVSQGVLSNTVLRHPGMSTHCELSAKNDVCGNLCPLQLECIAA